MFLLSLINKGNIIIKGRKKNNAKTWNTHLCSRFAPHPADPLTTIDESTPYCLPYCLPYAHHIAYHWNTHLCSRFAPHPADPCTTLVPVFMNGRHWSYLHLSGLTFTPYYLLGCRHHFCASSARVPQGYHKGSTRVVQG
jgi:hypothetical protein